MRKFPLITAVVLSLVGGAVISVGIAWICAVRSVLSMTRVDRTQHEPLELATIVPAPWLLRRSPAAPEDMEFVVGRYHGTGLELLHVEVTEVITGTYKANSDHCLLRWRAGWPFHALEGSTAWDFVIPPAVEHGLLVASVLGHPASALTPSTSRLLPCKPLGGFALDTLVYAAPLFASVLGLRWAGRTARIKQNRCPACNYSKAGLPPSAPCPECGTPPAP